MPSLRSPSLALPQCPPQTPTRSRRHLRFCLLEGPHIYLPSTSQGPLQASIPPTPHHHSKRRLLPHKWARFRSHLRLPHHTAWKALSRWTRQKVVMVLRTAGRRITVSRLGRGPNRQRRWILMPNILIIPSSATSITPFLIGFTEAGSIALPSPPQPIIPPDYASDPFFVSSLPLSPPCSRRSGTG